MAEQRIKKDDCLAALPAPWPHDLLPEIQEKVRWGGTKVVVLDDDPTGTQTVHGVAVLTEWTVDALEAELENQDPAVYVLTNSRSLPPAEAHALTAEIGATLRRAAETTGRPFAVVSRSDSTLRGHFPGEVDALAASLSCEFDAYLLIPFFLEGGRYTIENVHYVLQDDWLVPAAQTESARDAAFGYTASNLCQWVEEKTGGRVRASDVAAISLEDIRRGGPGRVADRLKELRNGRICAVNAACYRDLEVFTRGLLAAEAAGSRFLYRTAASFVRVRAGIAPRALLERTDLDLPDAGGALFVVGSYVPRSTAQVNELLAHPGIAGIEVSVEALLVPERRAQETERVAREAGDCLKQNRDVAVYTSRRLVTGNDAASSLSVGKQVSQGLVSILHAIDTRPRYLLAKGGITASDVATEALGVKRAEVPGQILPGVPVYRLGPESRYPGLSFIVFPGNVGRPEALVDIAAKLSR